MNRKYLVWIICILLVLVLAYWLYTLQLAPAFYYTAGWIVAVLILLVLGNKLITSQFDKYFPWLKFGGLRLFLHLFIGIVYSLVVVNLSYLAFKSLLTIDPPTTDQIIVMNVYGVVIFIPIFSVYFALQFLNHWKKSELEAEKFRKEHLRSQLESLKDHLDPHFLFNDLNILSSLMDKDISMSKKFLDKFAEVYRTLLKSKEEDLITIEEELEFIEAYIFLVKTRFENIDLTVNLDNSIMQSAIPPLTFQMLVENALKHNIISEKKPLKISITSNGNSAITVSNNLNEKREKYDTNGSGLKNIIERYRYFTEEMVEVNKTTDEFSVKIPIIKIETI